MRRLLGLAVLIFLLASCVMPASEPEPGRGAEASADGESAGRQIDIGNGRKLFLECRGEGSPTVLLESGIHDSAEYWVNIQPNPPEIGPDVFTGVAEHTRVCRYDRPAP